MTVDHEALANAVLNTVGNEQKQPTTPYGEYLGIVEALRAVIRPTPPFAQAALLKSLLALANAPGFGRESLMSAIHYLLEGNRITGMTLSDYGLPEKRERIDDLPSM